jgi:hypothetical protein
LTIPQLRNFSNASRQLGSSVGILSSAFHLRERLAHLLHLFRENAADLFPRKVAHPSGAVTGLAHPHTRKSWKRKGRAALNVVQPTVAAGLNLEDFPIQLRELARDVVALLDCLNEFPEFTDEAVNASIASFETDLKVRAYLLLHLRRY